MVEQAIQMFTNLRSKRICLTNVSRNIGKTAQIMESNHIYYIKAIGGSLTEANNEQNRADIVMILLPF
jgi:hypothetical protein